MSAARMSSEPTVLGIDAGTHSARAALFSFAGERLGYWRQLCDQTAEQDTVEQDPQAILAAARQCLDRVTLVGEVQAVAIVSQGASVVCYRRSDGRPLSPVLSWQDRRGESYLGQLSVSAEHIHQRTGLPLSCHYGATKLRWCLEHLPSVAKARRDRDLAAGPLMSWLLHHLCRERPIAVDSGSASRTQLWNLQREQWDADLCREFGIPTEALPRGRGTCSRFGTLGVGGRDVPVVCANRDQQAVLFADGWPRSHVAYVNLGTGAFIQGLLRAAGGPPELLINRVLSGDGVAEPLYSLEGTVHGVAGALSWLERHLGFAIVPQLLEDVLAHDPPADKTVYFVNGVMGMGSPYWRSQSVGRFSDLLTAREKLLGWLESVVFMLLENLRILATQTRVERLSLSGGFSNLTGLVQRLADLSGLPCQRRVDHEATLRGAAFLAAGQPEAWQPVESLVFQPAPNPGLQQRYQQWRTAMSNLS